MVLTQADLDAATAVLTARLDAQQATIANLSGQNTVLQAVINNGGMGSVKIDADSILKKNSLVLDVDMGLPVTLDAIEILSHAYDKMKLSAPRASLEKFIAILQLALDSNSLARWKAVAYVQADERNTTVPGLCRDYRDGDLYKDSNELERLYPRFERYFIHHMYTKDLALMVRASYEKYCSSQNSKNPTSIKNDLERFRKLSNSKHELYVIPRTEIYNKYQEILSTKCSPRHSLAWQFTHAVNVATYVDIEKKADGSLNVDAEKDHVAKLSRVAHSVEAQYMAQPSVTQAPAAIVNPINHLQVSIARLVGQKQRPRFFRKS